MALNKAHVLSLNTKICPVFASNTKEADRPKVMEGCSKTSFPRTRNLVNMVKMVKILLMK